MEDVSAAGNKTSRGQNVVVVARVQNLTPAVAAGNGRIPTLRSGLSDILNIVAQIFTIEFVLDLRERASDSNTGIAHALDPGKYGRRVRIGVTIPEIELLKTEN